jgi:hypothetical protein
VQSRYLLTYTPSHQELDGRFRQIQRHRRRSPVHGKRRATAISRPSRRPVRPTLEFSARTEGSEAFALEAQDLEIDEDDVPQTIEAFQEANTPISIALTLDGSGSIKPALESLKDAARTFVGSLRPSDPLALVEFADAVVVSAHVVEEPADQHRCDQRASCGRRHRALGRAHRFDRAARSRAGAQGGGRGDGWPR